MNKVTPVIITDDLKSVTDTVRFVRRTRSGRLRNFSDFYRHSFYWPKQIPEMIQELTEEFGCEPHDIVVLKAVHVDVTKEFDIS